MREGGEKERSPRDRERGREIVYMRTIANAPPNNPNPTETRPFVEAEPWSNVARRKCLDEEAGRT